MPPAAPTSPWPIVRMAYARRALAVVVAAIIVGLGAFSAQAALLLLTPVLPAHPAVSRAVPPPAVRTLLPSPARGATGTAPLPPEPATATLAADDHVVAALPFGLRGIGATDRGRAVECLAAAIYYEAASEPLDGQRAVAQVILNRVRHPAFPPTVCGVVYQGSERSGCQFSFACAQPMREGAMARVPSRAGWAQATRVAAAALAGDVYAPVGLATHYHTYAVTPAWNRSLVMTDAVGAHFFHRWRGYWGTRDAFARRYRGHEPAPGPHPAATVAAVVAEEAPPPAVALVAPRVQASAVKPAPTPAPTPTSPAASPESQILERWRDSGKPLTRD